MSTRDIEPIIEENGRSHVSPFEQIRRVTEEGYEYWSARDLAEVLGYKTNYRNLRRLWRRPGWRARTAGNRPRTILRRRAKW